MKTLVVYDSMYGNTEKIGRAIADAIAGDVKLLTAAQTNTVDLEGSDLLIAGSPTQGGRPSPAMAEFLKAIPEKTLANVGVAAFDTRFAKSDHGVGLRVLMRVVGFAAGRIAEALVAKGGKLLAEPEGFIVLAKEGPLREGELERAASWAKEITRSRGD